MARRRSRTVRTWKKYDVGLVGPDDVRALQTRLQSYRDAIQMAVGPMKPPLATDGSKWSEQAWTDLSSRVQTFIEDESTNPLNPMAYLYAGSTYERGRQLLAELDSWRDFADNAGAKNVPAPVPVPHADIGLAGGIGFALAAVVAILALREAR